MADTMELFRAERRRQVEAEGWTPEHDDEHDGGEMMRAALVYLWWGTDHAPPMIETTPMSWPWSAEWWKPKDRRSNLIRAGGLILAEKERKQRAGQYVGNMRHWLRIVARELEALDHG